jgi:hypothetical protein
VLVDAVEKALRGRLSKLAKTQADRRMLLLERDQAWVGVSSIYDEIERRRPQFGELDVVNEIWIADTASFEEKGRYVCFSCLEGGVLGGQLKTGNLSTGQTGNFCR